MRLVGVDDDGSQRPKWCEKKAAWCKGAVVANLQLGFFSQAGRMEEISYGGCWTSIDGRWAVPKGGMSMGGDVIGGTGQSSFPQKIDGDVTAWLDGVTKTR